MLFIFLLLQNISFAQTETTEDLGVLPPVLVREVSEADASLLGFNGFLLTEVPVSQEVYQSKTLQENRISRLADATSLDASLTDSYNATGYWDMVSIRGFTLDNRNNFRRDGLPINAETAIPLENKSNLQVLKGLAGVQAGVGAPGGIINYQVKRPTTKRIFDVRSEVTDSGNFSVGVDAGNSKTDSVPMDYRVNAVAEYLSPHLKSARGERALLAGALSWHLASQALLELEYEWSFRSQPSQPGMSLLGGALPQVPDPALNLNNQNWSQPVQFMASTGSLKYSQILQEKLSWSATLGGQSLVNNDRLAYPFGCTKDGNFDRYCSDGTFDFYDFRSENEHRDTQALRFSIDGSSRGEFTHTWSVGSMGWKSQERYQRQAYNYVGEGNVEGTASVPGDATLNDESTNRDAKNLQVFASDAIHWNSWTAWLGGSWNGVNRSSVRTDGSRATDYYQSFILPWGALSYQFERVLLYASYAEGMESYVTPNRNTYTHPGEFLNDVRSYQYELGLRGSESEFNWDIAIFQLTRPVVTDQAPRYQVDGIEVHRGLEVDLRQEQGAWSWNVAGMFLQAEREKSDLNSSSNGKKPVNVPDMTLLLGGQYHLPTWSGFAVRGRLVYEGERSVLPDNSIVIPGWVRADLGANYSTKISSVPTRIDLLIENLMDSRYWRESPTQYGHVYLYPGAERTLIMSLLLQI